MAWPSFCWQPNSAGYPQFFRCVLATGDNHKKIIINVLFMHFCICIALVLHVYCIALQDNCPFELFPSQFSKWIRSNNTMRNWINTPGYPVVQLNYSSKKRRVYVTQASSLVDKKKAKRFVYSLLLNSPGQTPNSKLRLFWCKILPVSFNRVAKETLNSIGSCNNKFDTKTIAPLSLVVLNLNIFQWGWKEL